MVQPKYSPEEALQRIKLMMEYNNSKTLGENIQMISEQTNNIGSDVGTIMKELDRFNSDEQKIVDIVKNYNTKTKFQEFINQYKTISGKDFGHDIFRAVTPFSDKTEWDDLKKHLSTLGINLNHTTIDAGKTGIATFDGLTSKDNVKPIGDAGPAKTGGYKSCSGTYSKGCKTEPTGPIGVVQGCLGLVPPDGKFGSKTQAALRDKGFTTFTDADVNKICEKTTPTPTPTPAESEFEDIDGEEASSIIDN